MKGKRVDRGGRRIIKIQSLAWEQKTKEVVGMLQMALIDDQDWSLGARGPWPGKGRGRKPSR